MGRNVHRQEALVGDGTARTGKNTRLEIYDWLKDKNGDATFRTMPATVREWSREKPARARRKAKKEPPGLCNLSGVGWREIW